MTPNLVPNRLHHPITALTLSESLRLSKFTIAIGSFRKAYKLLRKTARMEFTSTTSAMSTQSIICGGSGGIVTPTTVAMSTPSITCAPK